MFTIKNKVSWNLVQQGLFDFFAPVHISNTNWKPNALDAVQSFYIDMQRMDYFSLSMHRLKYIICISMVYALVSNDK